MPDYEFHGNVLVMSIGGASILACEGECYDKKQLIEMLGQYPELTAVPLPDIPHEELLVLINKVLDDFDDGNEEKYPERYTISL